jgi:hypothetical protein
MTKRVFPGQSDGDRSAGEAAQLSAGSDARGSSAPNEESTVSSMDTFENRQASRSGSTDLSDAVGSQLRTAYSELLNQPVPDKFALLLSKLKASEEDTKEQKS